MWYGNTASSGLLTDLEPERFPGYQARPPARLQEDIELLKDNELQPHGNSECVAETMPPSGANLETILESIPTPCPAQNFLPL